MYRNVKIHQERKRVDKNHRAAVEPKTNGHSHWPLTLELSPTGPGELLCELPGPGGRLE
jgi:hypothetical protein